MSLFKTKEWWRTVCGHNETFDRRSLLVGAFFGPEKKDVVIVGSQDGYLRIYKPCSEWVEETKSPTGYKSTDLVIETKICECIVDMKTGRFVSGSQDTRLAVLTSSKLVVYNVVLTDGSTEYGDRCDLEVVYEHRIPRFPCSLTVGPFGGVRGRDFLCVQSLDGSLFFYEQEHYAFGQTLNNRLLAEPIVYISRNDVFVTTSSSWILECYRYQSMAESVRSKERTGSETAPAADTLEPDWCYNIGEAVLDIDTVTLSSFEVGIVVLGEKNLYCLKDNCVSLRYAKRLDYKPLCFQPYVIEPDGKLMVLVIADTSTLMVYEGTALKWSAQLPFSPVAVARAHFQNLQGTIVILSEDGRLEVCYLGSEPAMFVAGPLHRRGYDYVAAEDELLRLRELWKKKNASDDRSSDAANETELIISINTVPDLGNSRNDSRNDSTDERQTRCGISIELSSYTTLQDVEICVDVCEPLRATKQFHAIPNLCDRHVLETMIYLAGDLPPISSEIRVTASYRNDRGNSRTIQKTSQLPLTLSLKSCQPENASAFAVTLKSNEPLLSLNQLFPEFSGRHPGRESSNALGLRHVQSDRAVTVVSGNTSNRYRVQSSDGLSTTLVVQQLLARLTDKTTGRSLSTSIAQIHIQLVHSQMEKHSFNRQRIDEITNELGLLTSQLRNIEKRMLRTARERNVRSLADTGLPFLLEANYLAIFTHLENLANAIAEREKTSHGLYCALRLLLQLLRLNVSCDKYASIEAAIGFQVKQRNQANWEEIADVALASLIRSTSRKSGSVETKVLTWNTASTSKDLAKMKKRLAHMVDVLDGSRVSDIAEIEQQDVNDLVTASEED